MGRLGDLLAARASEQWRPSAEDETADGVFRDARVGIPLASAKT
jgi:hypothetical protein